jgi:hypothetical protein
MEMYLLTSAVFSGLRLKYFVLGYFLILTICHLVLEIHLAL